MHVKPLCDDGITPLLIQPEAHVRSGPEDLVSWVAGHRPEIDAWVHRHGAVLFRGFRIGSAQAFRDVAAAYSPELLNYVGGDSPRNGVADQVYTSTEFPAHLEIGLHNELSYTRSWPERLFFCALVTADSGGETHIADGRKVLSDMEPAVRDLFTHKGVLYQQHLRDGDERGPGKSWQETFETTDRAEVERICTDQNMAFQWTVRGLRTSLRNPGVIAHPITGETCWFNQADLWHASFDTVKAREDSGELEIHDEHVLGSHACFGDGTEIPSSTLESVRVAYRRAEILFPWQPGDLLVLDNVLVMHGRKPFTGDRRVLVAMA